MFLSTVLLFTVVTCISRCVILPVIFPFLEGIVYNIRYFKIKLEAVHLSYLQVKEKGKKEKPFFLAYS